MRVLPALLVLGCGGGQVRYHGEASAEAHTEVQTPATAASDEPMEATAEDTVADEVEVTEPPPAPRVEVRPRQPSSRHVWCEGHWEWQGRTYVWIDGRWERPRRGHAWVPTRVERRGQGWIFVRAHWRREE